MIKAGFHFLLVFIFGISLLNAQPNRGRIFTWDVDDLKEKLALDDEQRVIISGLIEKVEELAEADRSELRGKREEIIRRAIERMKQLDADIEGVLNEEQKAKFELFKKERNERLKNRNW